MRRGDDYWFRSVPTVRVKAFIEAYMDDYYRNTEDAVAQFAFDSKTNPRQIWRIRNQIVPNVTFDCLDNMLVNLGCLELWHVPADQGGFADYFHPDIPPAPVPPNMQQARAAYVEQLKKYAKRVGMDWVELAHKRALKEDGLRMSTGMEAVA